MSKSIPIFSLFLWVCLLAISQRAMAYQSDYLPLSTKERGQRFAIKTQSELSPASGNVLIPLGKQVLTGTLENNETLTLKGKDEQQRPFSILLAPRDYKVFSGDLDDNGKQDLILIFDTHGNGLAPTQHVLTYLFDAQGRPFPFAIEGYFDRDKMGLPDLLDLNQDGKSELVYMHYQKGYWITELYTANNGRWQRISGKFAGKSYPLYSRFTQRPNTKPAQPPKPPPFRTDFSTSSLLFEGQLTSIQWAHVEQSEDIHLHIKPAKGLPFICQPDSWNSTFTAVIDKAQGRFIVSLDHAVAMQTLLQQLTPRPHQLQLFGQRTPNACSPEVLWAF